MKKWIEKYRVNTHDTDLNRVVSTSGILRYMQDAVNLQMENTRPSYEELFDSGLSFILSRIRVSSYTPLHSHDEISVETWACKSHGVSFNRCYRILRDGAVVAEAISVWALMDLNTHRPRRVSSVELDYGDGDMLELDSPTRIKIPSGVELSLVGEHRVEYAEVDINRHMNNTYYPDVFAGFIREIEGSRIASIGISYVSEAPLGETLKIYMREIDGTYYCRSVKEDGTTNAEAEIILEKLI